MTPGDKVRALAKAPRVAFLRTIQKYSGGKVTGTGKRSRGVSPNTTVPASDTILNSHFSRNNSRLYAPLSEPYATRKQKKFGKKPILVASGRMKRSLVGRARISPKGKDAYIVTFPSKTAYADFQGLIPSLQKGRHPTKPNKNDLKEIAKVAAQELKTVARAIGRL